MPSVRRQINRLAVLLAGASLLAGAAGCSTTQEKAELQQARAKHILETRDARKQKKRAKARQEKRNGSQQQ